MAPSPMAIWVIENEDWPEDPSPSNWKWWIDVMQNQEALGHSPRPFLRVLYWLTIKQYVIWWLLYGWVRIPLDLIPGTRQSVVHLFGTLGLDDCPQHRAHDPQGDRTAPASNG